MEQKRPSIPMQVQAFCRRRWRPRWPWVLAAALVALLLIWLVSRTPGESSAPSPAPVSTAQVAGPPWQMGNPEGRFTLTLYADLECPFCREYFPQLKRWVGNNTDVALQWHHQPLAAHEPAASAEARLRRLMHDLPHPAFVLNLRWDVLGFNAPADALFGFDTHAPERRNLLWLLFTDPILRERVDAWEEQAPLMLSSFRRDFARATQEANIHELVDELERVSPEFKAWWRQHDVHAPCNGMRKLVIDGKAEPFEHTSLTVDEDRHLRLTVYARQLVDAESNRRPE